MSKASDPAGSFFCNRKLLFGQTACRLCKKTDQLWERQLKGFLFMIKSDYHEKLWQSVWRRMKKCYRLILMMS